jgi:hypothetical protein
VARPRDPGRNKDDYKVLKKVISSNVAVNIKKLDLIIGELNNIKKAMIEAESAREAINS